MLSDLGEVEPPKWRNNLYIFFNREERKKYYAHIKKSVSKPHKYLSLIIDGLDQGKSHLAHFVKKSKVDNTLLSNIFLKILYIYIYRSDANVLSCLKSDPSYEFIGEVILKINIV